MRNLFGQLVNAEPGRIAVISSASYGMGIVIRNMKAAAGKKIITVHEEFQLKMLEVAKRPEGNIFPSRIARMGVM